MNRALRSLAAMALLAGCYASHGIPPEGRDAGTPVGSEPSDAGRPVEVDPGTCRRACATAADCGDRALRTCMDGACYFVGCSSDADCPPTAGCVRERRQCRERCETTADCTPVGSDNGEVECMDGLCRFVGCPSDAWCRDHAERWSLEGRYVCRSRPSGAIPRCWQACATDGDCPPNGSDHPRRCVAGICRMVDCTADDQCQRWHADDWLCAPR